MHPVGKVFFHCLLGKLQCIVGYWHTSQGIMGFAGQMPAIPFVQSHKWLFLHAPCKLVGTKMNLVLFPTVRMGHSHVVFAETAASHRNWSEDDWSVSWSSAATTLCGTTDVSTNLLRKLQTFISFLQACNFQWALRDCSGNLENTNICGCTGTSCQVSTKSVFFCSWII